MLPSQNPAALLQATALSAEEGRLAALRRYDLLNTPPEAEYDALVRLAAYLTGAPIALITLLDEDRQWFKAKTGVSVSHTPRSQAFCQYTIQGDAPLEVADAQADERFRQNPFVTGEPHIRYYCGVPLVTPEGYRVGSLCVLDNVPRQLDAPRQQALQTLASEVIARMELRRQQKALQLTNEELRATNESLQLANQELMSANVTLHHLTQELEVTNSRLVAANQQVARLMEERLAQRETQFRELTESITHMFFAVDADLRFLYWNRACEQFTGKSVQAVIGTTLYQLYPSFRGSRTDRTLRRVLEEKEAAAYEYHNRATEQYFEVHVFPSNLGLSVLIKDITEKKQKEQEILALNQQLTERNFELDQIVYKISHDIRSPLTSILGLVNIIKLEPLAGEAARYIDLMENRVKKLDRFTQAMLDFSRTTRAAVAAEAVDVAALLTQCRQELEYLPHSDRLQVSVQVTGETLYSDPLRLKIIFANLLANAIKYQCPDQPSPLLDVRVAVSKCQATMVWQDNGMGIAGQYLPRIFEMFFRATDKAEGSGLGMYIVKQTVDKLEGTIGLDSTLGRGTRIELQMPNRRVDQ